MSTEGTLSLEIQTAPLERAAKSLDDLASAAKRTETAVVGVETGAATAGAAMGTLGSKAAGTNRSLSSAADELRNVTRAATDLSSAASRVRGFDSIASMSADLKSLLASVQQVNQALLASVAAQSSAARAAEDSQRKLREQDAALREQARSAREAARAAAEKAAADARAASAGDAFIASLKRQAETVGFSKSRLLEYQAALLGVSKQAAPLIAQLNAAEQALAKTGNAAGDASRNVGGMAGVAGLAQRALAGLSLGIVAREFVQAADSANLMAARLKLATASLAEFAEAQRGIYSISQAYNTGLQETSTLYTRLADPVRKLGGTARETAGIVEALSASLKISGASSAESSAAILQFAQALASGRLQGDELRSLSEAAPRFMKALADGIGVGTGALKEMGSEGQLTADVVGNALLKSLSALRTEAAGIGDSVGGSFQRLQNDTLLTVEALDKAFGVTRAVSEVMSSLSSLVKGVGDVFRDEAATGANAAAAAFDTFGASTRVLGTLLETVLVVAGNIGSVLKVIGIQIGSSAAQIGVWANATADQLNALKTGSFADMPKIAKGALASLASIQAESAADISKAATDLEAYEQRVLGITKKALQARDALRLGSSVDTAGSDRKFDSGFSVLKAATDEKELIEIRLRLAGINKEYLESLTQLQKRYEAGRIPLGEYQRLVSELAVATYKSSSAGKEAAKAAGEVTKSAADALAAQIEDLKRSVAEREQITKAFIARQNSLYRLGQVSELQLASRVAEEEAKSFNDRRAALEIEARLLARKKNSKKEQATLTAQIAALDQSAAEAALTNAERILLVEEKIRLAYVQRVNEANEAVASVDRQIAAAKNEATTIGMTTAQLARLTIARAEEAAKAIEVAAIWSNGGDELDEVGAAALRLADRLKKLGKADASNLALKDLAKYLDADKAYDFGDKLASSLGRAGDAMQDLLGAFADYAKAQAKFDNDRKAASYIENATQRAKVLAQIEADSSKAQIQSYGQMAGAAANFFNTNSKGYQTLRAIEAGFTAFQLAQNVIKGASLAAVGVANQAQGEPYSAFARMAAMAAAMGALGFAVTGGFSGGGASGASAAERQAAQGRGTVLGDASAQSTSISNSLDRLQDSAKIELRYQSGMLAALRNIESAMSGLATLVIRTNGLTSGNGLGVGLGTTRNGSAFLPREFDFTKAGDSMLRFLGPSILDRALGGTIGKLADNSMLVKFLSGLSKTTSEIVDSGLTLAGTVADLISGAGVGQYATIQSQTKYLGFIKGGTKTNTVSGDLNDEQIARQFGLIFSGVRDALDAAADSLGIGTSNLSEQIEQFAIQAQQVSLRGLSGTALQEAVSGVISGASDSIAEAFFPGLQRFQQVGEGMLETVLRVASGVESAGYALERFGLKAIDFSDIINAQGDVSGEIVRQTIVAAEKAFRVPAGGVEGRLNWQGNADRTGITDTVEVMTGVGRIIESLSGSASDIAEVYQALLDVRAVMKSVGETGLDLSQAMLRGAGGLDALKSGLDAYLEGFFTTAEQTAAATARLGDQFVRIGVAMPTSNAEFRKLVEGIDTTSESGQLLYGQVIALAGAFAELNPLAQEAANAVDLLAAKRLQELRIMELQGDAAGALAGRRADELASLRKGGYDEEYLANQRLIYSLEDAAEAASKAAAAEADRARAAEAVAQQAATFQRQILELRDDTAGLRALDLQGALSDENRAMLSLIHTLTDAKAAADLAAQAEATRQQAIEAQTKSLGDQIFQLENAGNQAALRAREFADLADPSLEPLLRRLHALQDEATAADAARRAQEEQARVAEQLAEAARQAAEALANQRTSILDDIFNLENAGNVAALRERELLALDASLRPLKERYFALLDIAAAEDVAARAADERASIEGDILSLLGDTAAIRARELAALDPSNRDLKAMFYALQDQQAAAEVAQRAAEEAAQAAQQLAEAWDGVADTLLEEVDRIRSSMAANVLQSYAQLQGQFAIGTAAARAGDMTAAQSLPALAQSMLEAARNSASSAAEFRFAQASTAASLEQTAAIARQIGDSAAPAQVVGTQALPSYTIQQPQTVFVTSDPAAQQEIAALKQQIAEQDKRFALMESALVAIATSTSRIARSVDSVTGDNGDSIAVSTREGDALEVTP